MCYYRIVKKLIIENGKLKVSNQMENVIEIKSFDFAVVQVSVQMLLRLNKRKADRILFRR